MRRQATASQRRVAALFMALAVPAALGIVLAGGAIALLPLLLLLAPIMVLGRAPGIEALDRVRTSLARRRERPARTLAPAGFSLRLHAPRPSLLIADSLAGRAPPAPAAFTS